MESIQAGSANHGVEEEHLESIVQALHRFDEFMRNPTPDDWTKEW